MSPRFLSDVFPVLKAILNSVGLASAVLVVVVMGFLRCHRPSLVDRVSLRLQWAIALVDIGKHILLYQVRQEASTSMCAAIGFLMCFLDQVYFMLNIAIVANMQLMFVHNKFPRSSWEFKYWCASFGVATLITAPPLGTNLIDPSNIQSWACMARTSSASAS